MSFSYKFNTLRNGNSYKLRTRPEMSAHEDEVTGVVEVDAREENEENSVRFSPDSVGERIKASRTFFALCLQARGKIQKKLLVRAKFKCQNDSRTFVTETKIANTWVSVKHLYEILGKFRISQHQFERVPEIFFQPKVEMLKRFLSGECSPNKFGIVVLLGSS